MKCFFAILFSTFVLSGVAQTNYTGIYGYTESRKDLSRRIPGITNDESGYSSKIIFLRINDNQYRFWLYIIKGFPSYNSGQIEGIIHIQNDSAVYYSTDTLMGTDCVLKFRFSAKEVFIYDQKGGCGFGANVTAYGRHPKRSSTLPSAADIAKIGQAEISTYKIKTEKAPIYRDEHAEHATGQYFTKGDLIYAFDQTEESVFFQHITKHGKYIEGWIRKKDLRY